MHLRALFIQTSHPRLLYPCCHRRHMRCVQTEYASRPTLARLYKDTNPEKYEPFKTPRRYVPGINSPVFGAPSTTGNYRAARRHLQAPYPVLFGDISQPAGLSVRPCDDSNLRGEDVRARRQAAPTVRNFFSPSPLAQQRCRRNMTKSAKMNVAAVPPGPIYFPVGIMIRQSDSSSVLELRKIALAVLSTSAIELPALPLR